MASAAIFSSLRRRRSPSLEAFLAPVDLSDVTLVETLASVSTELVSCFSGTSFFFQRKNSRSLIRKIELFGVLLEYLRDSGSGTCLSPTAVVCFKELYLLLYRSKILLNYCAESSKLWLLLQNQSISGHFHDVNQEISTLLDVFPLDDHELSDDVREQIELMQKQTRKARLYIDKNDEALRVRLFSFLDEFENGRIPGLVELRSFFVDSLGIRDAKSCRTEIEFLEEQIVNHEGDVEPSASVLNGFVAITRYCRFLLFGFETNEVELQFGSMKKPRKRLITQEIANTFITIPKDFCCPISLDLMRDPVIVSTGQTYDRSSISRWVEDGHSTCPKTGQMLTNTRLVPNRALRNLIVQWCTAHGIACEPPENTDSSAEAFAATLPSKAAIEANRATATLLIQQLANGSQGAKTIAAREIRLLAKTGKENRAFIAEAGAIPHLCQLLSSSNPVAQENSVTAMLNLSIYDKNKSRIMDEKGCLGSIVEVLMFGLTTEARENAAATLFSLSAVHDYKKRIADEGGAVEALAGLLRVGTPRGKKDAVTALFNLSTHTENCVKMIEAGAVTALVGALGNEGVAEEAAGALALIVRQPIGAEAVSTSDHLENEAKEDRDELANIQGSTRQGKQMTAEGVGPKTIDSAARIQSDTLHNVRKSSQKALRTLFVSGIPQKNNKRDALLSHFQKFGEVIDIYIPLNGERAFVQFSKREEAEAALKAPDAVMGNRFIKLWWANRDSIPDDGMVSSSSLSLTPRGMPVGSVPPQSLLGKRGKDNLQSAVSKGAIVPPSDASLPHSDHPKPFANGPKAPPPMQKKLDLEKLRDELRKKQEMLDEKRNDFRRQLDKLEKQATGVKGEAVVEPAAKRQRVGIAIDVAKTTTPRSSDPVVGVSSPCAEMIVDKNKSTENVASSIPKTSASLMQHESTASRQLIRPVAPTGAVFLTNRYKLDNRPTAFKIIPPLPPGLANVDVLKEFFSLYGDLSAVELEDVDACNDDSDGSEVAKNCSARLTFTTRRSAERAFFNGRCWQSNNLKFTWVTSSAFGSDLSGRENISSALKCPVDTDVQPTEKLACTGSGSQEVSASENGETETSERNTGADHVELHEVSELLPTSEHGEDTTKCEDSATSMCSKEEQPKRELNPTATSGENESHKGHTC